MIALIQLRQPLALVRLGLFFILGCWLLLALGLRARAEQTASQPLNTPLPSSTAGARPIPLLGITVALEQYTPTARRAALARLKAAGFGWVRQPFDWAQLEPQAGHYQWQFSDAVLRDITASQLIPVVVLNGSPAWARTALDIPVAGNPFAPPADPATFARFAAAFASRYHEPVRFYQIWDEPNLSPHWGNHHIEPVEYALLLKRTAVAIRAADADAFIISAALAPTADRGHTAIDEVYFLQRLYAAGAAPYFDAVAVEPFGFGAAPDDPRAQNEILNFQRIKLVRRAMLAAGDGATPLWAVRYGWNIRHDSPWGTVRPEDQIQFAGQALAIAQHQWPWLATLGWMIDQPAQPTTDPIWGFALTPAVARGIREWAENRELKTGGQSQRLSDGDVFARFPVWLIVVAFGVLGWRSVAAARLLPWRAWFARYRTWPVAAQSTLWGGLLLLYALASWLPLILLCWLAAALLIIAQPQVGLWLVAATLPFYFQHKEIDAINAAWAIAPSHAALLCLLPALLIRLFQLAVVRLKAGPTTEQPRGVFATLRFCVKGFDLHAFDWLALAWLGLNLLTRVNVWHWPAYWQGLHDLALMPLLGYVALRVLVETPQQRHQVVVALFLGGSLAAVIGLVDWLRGHGTEVDGMLRLVGPYFSPNHTALYLVRTLFLGLGLTLAKPTNRRRWGWGLCGVVGLALCLTASRGALLLGLPAGATLFAYFFLRQPKRQPSVRFKFSKPWLLVMLALGLLILGTALFFSWTRLTNVATASQRLITWQATWQLWRAYPLLGVGPGGFFWRYPAYLAQATAEPNLEHPHNVWLEFAANWGLIGVLWLGALLWLLIRLTRQTRALQGPALWIRIGLVAALVAGFAHAQVDTFAALADLAAWNWLALALLAQRTVIFRKVRNL